MFDVVASLALDGIVVDDVQSHGSRGGAAAVHEVDEFGQDVEFEFQLDAVDEDFDGFLIELEVHELEHNDADL